VARLGNSQRSEIITGKIAFVMTDELGEVEVFVGNLEIGMRVTRLDRPWEETDFLLQGFVIESEADIYSLRRQ